MKARTTNQLIRACFVSAAAYLPPHEVAGAMRRWRQSARRMSRATLIRKLECWLGRLKSETCFDDAEFVGRVRQPIKPRFEREGSGEE